MKIFLEVFYGTVFALMLIIWLRQSIRLIGMRSSSKRLSWIRRLYWQEAKQLLEVGSAGNWKVQSYLYKYLKESLAIKQHFINHGLVETRFMLIAKVEELERMVEEYKYNSFGKLSWDEERFIDEYQKKNRGTK